MSDVLKPCLDCGELSTQNRCAEHRREQRQAKEQRYIERHGHRRERLPGHSSSEWIRLSKKARAVQPWCLDCRRTEDELRAVGERLEADHLAITHWKQLHKQPLSLNDIEVVCGQCNRARGSSRVGTDRYQDWLETGHESRGISSRSNGNQIANAADHDGGSD